MVGESQVHRALTDQRQALLGLALPDVEHGLGVGRGEPGEGAGQKHPATAGERGDGELGAARAEPVDLLLRVFELGRHGLGGPDHDLACPGEGDAPGAAGDHLGAQAAFQDGYVLGHGRGGEVEGGGRPVEAPVLRHRPQDAEPLDIDQQFSLMRYQ